MNTATDTLYKKTLNGDIQTWRGEAVLRQDSTWIFRSWHGKLNGAQTSTEKVFNSEYITRETLKKTWNKKYAQGLYKTLEDVGIVKVDTTKGVRYDYAGGSSTMLKTALAMVLPDTNQPSKPIQKSALPTLDDINVEFEVPPTPKTPPKEKPTIDPKLKIVFQLPRL
jgi:hypothetical protein